MMEGPVSAAQSSDQSPDDLPVEEILALADSLVTSLQQGVAEQAWTCLPQLADELQDTLVRLDLGLRNLSAKDPGRAVRLAPGLAGVAGRHAAVLGCLTSARDQTAAELAAALQGHEGAAQYLKAAGGS